MQKNKNINFHIKTENGKTSMPRKIKYVLLITTFFYEY